MPDQDVIWVLDKGVKAYKTRKYERHEPKPWTCQNCFSVNEPSRRGSRACRACGLAPVGGAEAPAVGEGCLVRVQNNRRAKKSPDEKQKIWNSCFWRAVKRGLKVGAAAHMYKKKMNVFPKGLEGLPHGEEWQMSAAAFYEKRKAKAAAILAT